MAAFFENSCRIYNFVSLDVIVVGPCHGMLSVSGGDGGGGGES